MKDFMPTSMANLLPVLIVLLIVNDGLVQAIYTMNQTCLFYPEGFIANPDDCKSWGYCSGGALKYTGKCKGQYLYDTAQGICNEPSLVQCGTNEVNICANLIDPGWVPVPNNCNQYCYCANQKIIEYNSCPLNQFYDPNTQQCGYKYMCPIDSVCRLVPNNAFVGAPNNCGQFIRCLDGTGTAEPCNGGNYFNALTGYCQQSNPCLASNSPSNNSPTVNPPDINVCLKYKDAQGGTQFFGDSNTCYGYYTCSSNSGTGTWRKCLFGTHFDPASGNCVNPISVNCTKNRCANIDLPFVTEAGAMCKNYFICNNNQETAEAYSCPAGYPFFDEVKQGCVAQRPNYAICGATAA